MPGITLAAYLASIPVKPFEGGVSVAGVSGGGGEPRAALVVEVEAVESSLLIPAVLAYGTFSPPPGCGVDRAADEDEGPEVRGGG